jgi:hypothetical protein
LAGDAPSPPLARVAGLSRVDSAIDVTQGTPPPALRQIAVAKLRASPEHLPI